MNQATVVELEDILETGVWQPKERIPFTRPQREEVPPTPQPIPYKPVPAQPIARPIPSSQDLNESIAEAQAAKDELDRLEELRRQASQLEALQKRQQELEWAEGAAPMADVAEQQAQLLLDQAKPELTRWRTEFVETFAKLEALLKELPTLQKPIPLAIEYVKKASDTRRRIDAIHGKETGDFLQDTGFELWQEVGGTDPALAPLPICRVPVNKWQEVIKVLLGRLPFIYTPSASHKLFG